MKNNIFIISGPSGAGEDSIIEGLRNYFLIERVITTTTREPRIYEIPGKDYYFLNQEEFLEKVENQEFVEHAKEYNNQYYGVTKSELERVVNSGKVGIWKIEYKGVLTAKKLFPDVIAILITAPLETMERRIRNRKDLSEEEVRERMNYSQEFLKYEEIYDYKIENLDGELDNSIKKTAEIIKSHLSLDKV